MAFTIEPDSTETSATPWQILVVDDDVSVHVATETAALPSPAHSVVRKPYKPCRMPPTALTLS